MDLYCTRCGEPWDMDTLLHDDPEGFDRKGGRITACPACRGQTVNLSEQEAERLAIIGELADLAGDDLDGLAADLEDFGL